MSLTKGDIVIKCPSDDTIVTPLHWKDLIKKSKSAYTESSNCGYTLYEVTMVVEGLRGTKVCLIDLSAKKCSTNGVAAKLSVAKPSDLRLATPYEIVQWKMQGKNKHG